MTFTHRVTAEELAAEALDEMPDLSVVLWEARDGLALDDGSGRVQTDYTEMAVPRLGGPPDWIEAVKPGDLLAFTRIDGVLSVEVIGEASSATAPRRSRRCATQPTAGSATVVAPRSCRWSWRRWLVTRVVPCASSAGR
jgi:hypothetical protein